MFAGKECGLALAKMSFDPELLNCFEFDTLNFGEKEVRECGHPVTVSRSKRCLRR